MWAALAAILAAKCVNYIGRSVPEDLSCGGLSRPRKRPCIRQTASPHPEAETTSSRTNSRHYRNKWKQEQNRLDGGAIKRPISECHCHFGFEANVC